MTSRLFIVLYMLFAVHAGATNLSGGIYTNTTWTLSGSPYVMTGNVVVFEGVDLTIEPGVIISVDTGLKLEVRGRIIAKGTAGQNITFKGNSPTAGKYYWQGVVFIATADPLGTGSQATFEYCNFSNARYCAHLDLAYHGPYIFKHCNFTYNYQVNYDGGLGGMLFDSCTIKHNFQGFEYFQFGGRISNCTFDDNVYGVDGSDTLVNCTFTNHSDIAVQPYGYTRGCTISGNHIGVRCFFNSVNNAFIDNTVMNNAEGVDILSWFDGSIHFVGNRICSNTAYNIRLNTVNNCNLSGNCWCSTDSATIRSSIIDGYVDVSKGLVTIGTISTNCTTEIERLEPDAEADIYPNPLPVGEWLRITSNALIASSEIQMLDVQGRKCAVEVYKTGEQQYLMKPLDRKPGIYFLIIPTASGSQRITKRISIQ